MNKNLTLIAVIIAIAVSGIVRAEGEIKEASVAEPPPVAAIKISPDWGKAACASQPGKGISLGWKGAEDKRNSKAVGTLQKKKETIDILPSEPIESVVSRAVVNVLLNCGFEVKTKDDGAGGIATSVEVTDFFGGAKKGFFTGETEAKGSLVMHFSDAGRSYDFNLAASETDKRLKKKNIKQLEEVLSTLLGTIVSQISETPALFEEIKKIAGK